MDLSILKIAGAIASVDVQAARKKPKKKGSKKKVSKKPSRRTSRPRKEIHMNDMSIPSTEYSVHMDLTLSVEFEGNVEKPVLITKLKQEIVSSIESGITSAARSLDLSANNLRVKPLKVDLVINDAASLDELGGF